MALVLWALAAGGVSAQSAASDPSAEDGPPLVLEATGILGGAFVGGGMGLGFGVGVIVLGFELTRHEPYRETEEDEWTDCHSGCQAGRVVYFTFVGIPAVLGATIAGTALGVAGAYRWLHGDARVGTALLGLGVGGLAQIATIVLIAASDLERADKATWSLASTLLTVTGGVVGYLLGPAPGEPRRGRLRPVAAIDPRGGAYFGAQLAF